MKAIASKRIAGADLTADLVRQLQFLEEKEIDRLLKSVWGTVRQSTAEKVAMVAEYKELVGSTSHPKPDVELGRSVFAKTCMKCHLLYGVGFKVGPDLTGSNRADLDYLLSNIIDPSAVMAKEYRPTIIVTEDGRVVSGLVKAEEKNSVTIQTSDTLVVIPKDEIDRQRWKQRHPVPQ